MKYLLFLILFTSCSKQIDVSTIDLEQSCSGNIVESFGWDWSNHDVRDSATVYFNLWDNTVRVWNKGDMYPYFNHKYDFVLCDLIWDSSASPNVQSSIVFYYITDWHIQYRFLDGKSEWVDIYKNY